MEIRTMVVFDSHDDLRAFDEVYRAADNFRLIELLRQVRQNSPLSLGHLRAFAELLEELRERLADEAVWEQWADEVNPRVAGGVKQRRAEACEKCLRMVLLAEQTIISERPRTLK